jgi:hypothetical protein
LEIAAGKLAGEKTKATGRTQVILASYLGSFRQPDLAHLEKRHSHLAHLD